MTFYVNWKRLADRKLAAIWLSASNRSAVSEAARQIDETLRRSPESAGEQRDAGRRILIEYPLIVVFKVFPEDMRVDVLDIKRLE